jgi:hypothetical protein
VAPRKPSLLERFEAPGLLRAIVWLLALVGAVSLLTTR